MAATSMRTSTVGLKLIKSFEGCLLNAYKDPVGIWTIGYGHTDSVFKGQVITMAEAEDFLRADLVHVETHIQRVLAITVSQNQFDALASFVFNVGTTAFSRSTLLRKLNHLVFKYIRVRNLRLFTICFCNYNWTIPCFTICVGKHHRQFFSLVTYCYF